jgi:16S rRNA (cytosine1402-N4)-methyltransferase
MRMSQKNDLSAYRVVNEYDEDNLRRVFLDYGELKNAPAIARVILEAREKAPIRNTEQLKQVLSRFLPAHKSHKILAQMYQAIRIEVNQEMDVLKEFLEQSLEILKPEGRLSIISYHSLEDRLVKRFVKNGMFEGEPERDFFGNFSVPFKTVGKLIVPNNEQIKENNRARSAKLKYSFCYETRIVRHIESAIFTRRGCYKKLAFYRIYYRFGYCDDCKYTTL